MSGKFSNNIQAAILLDGGEGICPSMHLNNFRMEWLNKGLPLKIIQESVSFAVMVGPGDLYLHVTYYNSPADHGVFAGTLQSGVTGLLTPDAETIVRRHTSYVLVEVKHGVMGGVTDEPQIAAFLEEIKMPRPGHTLELFNLRVDILKSVIEHISNVQPISAVHWTQSNTLVSGQNLKPLLDMDHPSLLTVHPVLYGAAPVPGFKEHPVGLHTLGAADYIGREIHVEPAPVPWFDLLEGALAFIRVALIDNGYIVPDGDTFGPESKEVSFRVNHISEDDVATSGRGPLYQLTLLFAQQHDYVSDAYRDRELLKGGVREAAAMVEADPLNPNVDEARAGIADMEQTERQAMMAGNQFEVYRLKDNPPGGSQPPSPASGSGDSGGSAGGSFGKRATFGKRKTLH